MNAKHLDDWTISATAQQVCIMDGNFCIADCGAGPGAHGTASGIIANRKEVVRLRATNSSLLAALQACESALMLSGDRFNDHKAALVDQARAAIVKATEE